VQRDDDAELDELNGCLSALADLFPDVDLQFLSGQLQSASKDSRLAMTANIVADWPDQLPTRPLSSRVEGWQRFRPESYRHAVRKTLFVYSTAQPYLLLTLSDRQLR
jgi:hypothetical protein